MENFSNAIIENLKNQPENNQEKNEESNKSIENANKEHQLFDKNENEKNQTTQQKNEQHLNFESKDNKNYAEESQYDDDYDSQKATAQVFDFPISSSIDLKAHSNLISCFALDSAKNRLIVGSSDSTISFWDLSNLNVSLKPFRLLEPHDKQIISAVSFSFDDSKLLVCGGAKPKIMSRDGKEEIEFMKGDMYLRDLTYTKGHTSNVTHGFFSTTDSSKCYTSSIDGSIRIWDINARPYGVEQQLPCQTVIKCKNNKLQRAAVNHFLHVNGNTFIAFCEENSIQVFGENTKYARPELQCQSKDLAQVSHAKILTDGFTFVTREMDDTVKIFDLRNLKSIVKTFKGLPNYFEFTGISLSQNEKHFITGTSVTKNEDSQLIVQDLLGCEPQQKISVAEKSITSILWDHTINQIFTGIGEDVRVFYDEKKSKKGVIGAISKEIRKHKIEDEMGDKQVYVPNALYMFRPDQNHKRKRYEKVRTDEKLTKKPIGMLTGPGYNGMISGPRTTAQFIMKTIHQIEGKQADPVESLRKHEQHARENPQFVDSAYLLTQPDRKLVYMAQDADEQTLMSLFNKCKHCGMKICQCKTKRGLYSSQKN